MLKINNPSLIIKKLISFFFFYMILEGVLRKWIFPSLSTPIYFLKDIFLIIIYLIALKYNFIFKLKYSKLFIIFIILISLFGFLGYELTINGVISYVLGLRSYWLFLPLFLIIVNVYNKDDLIKFIKLNLFLVIPYFLLIYLQSVLPETSFLNSGYDGTLLSPERPSGYFTYTTQNTYYFLFLFFSFCSFILDKKEFKRKDIIYLSLLNFLLISVMILLKSRSVYFYVLVTILYSTFFIIFSNFDDMIKIKKIFLILIVSYLAFNITSSNLFEKQFQHSKIRMNTDNVIWSTEPADNIFVSDFKDKQVSFQLSEKFEVKIKVNDLCSKYSTICRIINDLYIIPAIKNSSFFGEGIGAGTKTVVIFNNIKRSFYLGEIDNKRIIMELGFIVGLMLVMIKFLIAIIINFLAFFKFREKDKMIYVPIVVFITTQLLLGTISYTSSFISFIFWFSLGLLFMSFNNQNKNL